jgi:hypothetical protein
MSVAVPLRHVSMRAGVCFDAATEGATGGMLGLLPTRLCSKAKGRDTPIEGVR